MLYSVHTALIQPSIVSRICGGLLNLQTILGVLSEISCIIFAERFLWADWDARLAIKYFCIQYFLQCLPSRVKFYGKWWCFYDQAVRDFPSARSREKLCLVG